MKQITKEIKDIRDYLHLYLGCECTYWHGTMMRQITGNLTGALLKSALHPPSNVYNLKPILRKLSSMTEEELIEIYKLDIDGNNSKYDGNNPSRRYMANFARQNLKEYKVVAWLLSKGFDLFGLIESGLALDKDNL